MIIHCLETRLQPRIKNSTERTQNADLFTLTLSYFVFTAKQGYKSMLEASRDKDSNEIRYTFNTA